MSGSGYAPGSNREEQGGALLTIGGQLDILTSEGGAGVTVDGVATSPADALVGVTATAGEINTLHSVTGGTARASSAVVLDANKALDAVRTAALKIGVSGSEVDYTNAIKELAAKSIGTATFVVGSETSEAVTVNVQLKDFAGADMAVRSVVTAWVSTDANGDSPGDGTATLVMTAGTDGALISTDESGATFVSESDGDLDIVITDSAGATQTCYLHIVSPLGEVFSSAVVTFAA